MKGTAAPLLFALFSVIIFSSFDVEKPEEEDVEFFRVLFSSDLFLDIDIKDVKAATQVWVDDVIKANNIKGKAETIVAESPRQLSDYIRDGVDVIVLLTNDYIKLRNTFPIEAICSTESKGKVGYEMLLVTNPKSGVKKISDLKNKVMMLHSKNFENPITLWMDSMLRAINVNDAKKFFADIRYEAKANNVVLPVFFNKAQAAILGEDSFNNVAELNPQIGKQLNILRISEPLLYGVVCVNGYNRSGNRREMVQKAFLGINKSAYGEQLNLLFRLDKLVPFREEHLNSVKNLMGIKSVR